LRQQETPQAEKFAAVGSSEGRSVTIRLIFGCCFFDFDFDFCFLLSPLAYRFLSASFWFFVYSFFFRLRVANKLLLLVAEYLSPDLLTTNRHCHYITAAAAAVAVSRLSFCFLDLVRRVFENLSLE
jgi:hypothetical protein